MNSSDRILFVDHLRGFAVVIMVMGHSIDSVLSLQTRSTDWFRIYDFFRGFTAPVFLFVSGWTFTVATARRWKDYRRLTPHLASRLTKILLLFVIGYALHMPFFSFQKILHNTTPIQYGQFFQADVLHCVAASLLFLHMLIPFFGSMTRFAQGTLLVALAIILFTPFVWATDFAPILSPALSPYLNQHQLSMFPLFPYASYLFFGVGAGHYFLKARKENREHIFFTRLALGAAIVSTTGVFIDSLSLSPYPPHDFWKTSPMMFAFRSAVVVLLTTAFFRLKNIPESLAWLLGTVGRYSLLVYTLHIVMVYGSAANSGLTQFIGQTLALPQAFIVGLIVLTIMILLLKGWNYVCSHHYHHSRSVQAMAATILLSMFLTLPH